LAPLFSKISEHELEECSDETRDPSPTTSEPPLIMAEESYSYRPKDVSDPKSPGWQHRYNANGVPIAGTSIKIQGQQWVNFCVNQVTACVSYKQKREQDHHALIKETLDLWRSVCKDNQETMTWFRTTVKAMVEEYIITEDNEVLLRLQSTITEYSKGQRPESMDLDPEMETALTNFDTSNGRPSTRSRDGARCSP
jgi:hypothetical protein